MGIIHFFHLIYIGWAIFNPKEKVSQNNKLQSTNMHNTTYTYNYRYKAHLQTLYWVLTGSKTCPHTKKKKPFGQIRTNLQKAFFLNIIFTIMPFKHLT